jgi:hypothetical protein
MVTVGGGGGGGGVCVCVCVCVYGVVCGDVRGRDTDRDSIVTSIVSCSGTQWFGGAVVQWCDGLPPQ